MMINVPIKKTTVDQSIEVKRSLTMRGVGEDRFVSSGENCLIESHTQKEDFHDEYEKIHTENDKATSEKKDNDPANDAQGHKNSLYNSMNSLKQNSSD